MWKSFKDMIMELIEQHVPVRQTKKQHKQSSWISGRTHKKLRLRNKAWRTYRKFPSTRNYSTYKELRNAVTALIREDRNRYQRKLIRNFKNCPKRFYGYMRNLQTVKSTVSQLKSNDGSLTTSDIQAADILCQSFHKVFTSEPGTFSLTTEPSDTAEDIAISFNSEIVMKKLLALKVDKSPGPDGLHPALLKE